MSLFDLFKDDGKSIDEYAAEAAELGIAVVDVRERKEFARGHIRGAVNVPLGELSFISEVAPNKSAALYVYCLSGSRSGKACNLLKEMGYANAVNIGGISRYRGAVER